MKRTQVVVELSKIKQISPTFADSNLESTLRDAIGRGLEPGLFVQIEYGQHSGCLTLHKPGNYNEWDAVITSERQDDGTIKYILYHKQ